MELKIAASNIVLNYNDLVTILADTNYSSSWVSFERISSTPVTLEDVEKLLGKKPTLSTVCFEDKLAADLENGAEIIVVDNYDEDKQYKVNKKNFQKAYAKLAKKYPYNFNNIISERFDIIDMDMVLQIATFGDVIYG